MAILTVWTFGCGDGGSQAAVPLGDQLDELLNLSALPNLYRASVQSCVAAQGADATEFLTEQESQADLKAPEAGPSSGLTLSVIDSLKGNAEPVASTTELDPRGPLGLALRARVTFNGVDYEGGCLEYGETVLNEHPAERQRLSLQKLYLDEVTVRLRADPDVVALNEKWSDCMSTRGYPGLTRPGAQMALIQGRIVEAAQDLAKLEAVLEFDTQVTQSAVACFEPLEASLVSVRRRLEKEFVKLHSAELDSVLLAVEEDARDSKSAAG